MLNRLMKQIFNKQGSQSFARQHKVMIRLQDQVATYPNKSLNVPQDRGSKIEGALKLRQAKESDLENFVALEAKGYQGYLAWTLDDFKQDWVQNSHLLYLVAECFTEDNKYFVGMITGRFLVDHTHISQLIVDPLWQSLGVGSYLLESWLYLSRFLAKKSVTLEVRESNCRAQKLYYRYGFQQVAKKEFYYEDNREAALLLRCLI